MSQNDFAQIATLLAALTIAVYGFLLVAGAPFQKSPDWANQYANWLFKKVVWLAGWLITLPFRIIFASLEWGFKKTFGGTAPPKKKKKKSKKGNWLW